MSFNTSTFSPTSLNPSMTPSALQPQATSTQWLAPTSYPFLYPQLFNALSTGSLFGNNVLPLSIPVNSLHNKSSVTQSLGQVIPPPTTNETDDCSDDVDQFSVQRCEWNDCGLEFPTLKALVEHVHSTHVSTAEPKCQWAGCNRNKKFKSRFELRMHLNNHTGNKPFKCKYPGCDKKYRGRQGLANHLETHSDVQYTCNFVGCQRTFVTTSDLERHHAQHAAKRYSCPLPDCLKSYVDMPSLRFHVRKVHGEEVYQAVRDLKYFFTTSPNGGEQLVRHVQTPQLPRAAKGFMISDILELADHQETTAEHAEFDKVVRAGASQP